jgi:hypothetical protein
VRAELLAPSSSREYPFKPDTSAGRAPPRGNGRIARGKLQHSPAQILPPDQSAALRDKLLADVTGLVTADLATAWAGQALAAKNSLTATDAKLVEDACESKFSQLSASEPAVVANEAPAPARAVKSGGLSAAERRATHHPAST